MYFRRSSKDHKNCCLQWYGQDPAHALETYDEYYTAYYLYTDKRYKYYQGNDWYNPTQEQINTGLYKSGINGITINIKEDSFIILGNSGYCSAVDPDGNVVLNKSYFCGCNTILMLKKGSKIIYQSVYNSTNNGENTSVALLYI